MGRKIKNNIPAETPPEEEIYLSPQDAAEMFSNDKKFLKACKNISPINPEKIIDRVANIEQKELALSTSGVTRQRVYDEISLMLKAVKKKEILKDGVLSVEEEPDMTVRSKGVELALKAFGDLKEFERAVNTTHNKVVYQWLQVNNSGINPGNPTRIE